MAENGTLTFNALDQSWSLRFDINAFCRIEDELGIESVAEFQAVLKENLSFRKLRTLFACGLTPAASEVQAGAIMSDLGLDRASALLTDTIQAAFPAAKGEAGNAAAAGKRKPTKT